MEEVGETAEGVGLGVEGGIRVDGLGEAEGEAVWGGVHGEDVEGDLSGPDDALESIRGASGAVPAAVGFADEHGSVFAEGHADHGGLEAVYEWKACTLVFAIYFFQEYAVDLGHGEIAYKELVGEGAEVSPTLVALDVGGTHAHFSVGKPDGGKAEIGEGLYSVRQEEFSGNRARVFEGGAGAFGIFQGIGVAVVDAFAEVVQGACRDPVALLVGEEHVAFGVGTEAAGGAHAGAHGDGVARCFVDDHTPSTPGGVLFHGCGANSLVEGDPEAALSVTLGAVGIFVVVTGDAPAVGHGAVGINEAVVVVVLEVGDFGPLGDE